MKKLALVPLFLSLFVLGGCGTVTSSQEAVTEGQNLSTSGLAYTTAVDALLEEATTQVIDFDSKQLVELRNDLSDPGTQLQNHTKQLEALLTEIKKFRGHTLVLSAYFQNLKALAESTAPAETGAAVQTLSENLAALNNSLKNSNPNLSPSAAQSQEIGALGRLIGKAVLGSKIRSALQRDAEVVATSLALQENQIGVIASILQRRFNEANDDFARDNVTGPFADTAQPLPASWADNRKTWLETRFSVSQLSTAQTAAKQLRAVWTDVVSGGTDSGSMTSLIAELNSFVTTIQALKTASENR